MPKLAPHDLRRSSARFCHAVGGELEQIQFLLGHVSVQTTEHYVGCKQRSRPARTITEMPTLQELEGFDKACGVTGHALAELLGKRDNNALRPADVG